MYRIFLILFLWPALTFSQNWAWTKQFGQAGTDYSHTIVTDGTGAIYVGGLSGSFTASLSKLDASGNVYWTDSLWQGQVYSIAYDQAGGLYVGGVSGTLRKVAKYDTTGNEIWQQTLGNGWCNSVTTDNVGNIYVTGAGPLIQKLDPNGNTIWSTNTIPGTGNSIYSDGQNLYVTGHFGDSASFGSITLTSAGYQDIFIAKYDSSGNCIWAKSAGGTYSCCSVQNISNAIIVDQSGYSYITGAIADTAYFDAQFVIAESMDMFIAKYDPWGNVVWVRSATGWSDQEGLCIASDNEGNLLVGGRYVPNIYFNSIPYTGWGNYDAFIAKYDGNGNFMSAMTAGGPLWNEEIRGICSGNFGDVFVTGVFFKPAYVGQDTLVSAGNWDYFVSKIDYSTGIYPAQDNSLSLSVYPNPCHSSATFQMNGVEGELSLILYDPLGREVKRIEGIQGSTYELSREGLSDGIYFYIIHQPKDGKQLAAGKLVIQ
jgi:hypothetical protein